jgi:hypothetical protein
MAIDSSEEHPTRDLVEQNTDPRVRVAVRDVLKRLEKLDQHFVSYGRLLTILGGTLGVALMIGVGIAGWTVTSSNKAVAQLHKDVQEEIAVHEKEHELALSNIKEGDDRRDALITSIYQAIVDGKIATPQRAAAAAKRQRSAAEE